MLETIKYLINFIFYLLRADDSNKGNDNVASPSTSKNIDSSIKDKNTSNKRRW